MQRVRKNNELFRKAELMAKVSLHDQEIDLVLLAIEMTNQARQVERCWKILGMINEARKTHPQKINRSLGYYRTVFDSLVLSVFIGLGRLYDKDSDTFSLYSLRELLWASFKDTHANELEAYSKRLKAFATSAESLRNWRGKQYAHNDRELAWQSDWLEKRYPLKDEDIEALIRFAREYCDFFSVKFLGELVQDRIPSCEDFWNTINLCEK